MEKYVALLRGINVGGNRMVSMTALREAMTDAGYRDVRTLLQSGNVIFAGKRRRDYGTVLAVQMKDRLGLETAFLVRSAAEWQAIIDRNPFAQEAKTSRGYLLVMALEKAPNRDAVGALRRAIVGRERVEASGSELYLVYPDGAGRSKLTNALIERTLGTRGTARNWNTTLKIAAALG